MIKSLLFLPLIIAWALLGVGPGSLPQAQAQPQPQNEESDAAQQVVVIVNMSRTLRLGSVQNLSHFRFAERRPALAHAVMAPLICWSLSNSMFRYLFVDHAVPAMWRSLAAARLSAD